MNECWIVCRPCDDPHYGGHPTGMVFTDEAQAIAYIDEQNGGPYDDSPDWCDWALYLEKGDLA